MAYVVTAYTVMAEPLQGPREPAYIVVAYIALVYTVMAEPLHGPREPAYIVMAHTVMTYISMAHTGMAYISMAHTGMAYIAMTHIVMACIVMAEHLHGPRESAGFDFCVCFLRNFCTSAQPAAVIPISASSSHLCHIVMTYIVMAFLSWHR